jgi:valyl-tRNA synthetase
MIHANSYDTTIIEQAEAIKEIITAIREVRAKSNLKAKDLIQSYYHTSNAKKLDAWTSKIMKLTNSDIYDSTDKEIENSSTFIIKGDKYFVVTGKTIDAAEEKAKLTKELDYINGFIKSIEARTRRRAQKTCRWRIEEKTIGRSDKTISKLNNLKI